LIADFDGSGNLHVLLSLSRQQDDLRTLDLA
jgi:hypothetical protein